MTFSFPLSLSHIYNTTRFKISSHVLWLWYIKGTLMQIWKSPYMIVFIQKQCYENFAFLILTIARCLPVKFVKFLKSRLFFFFFFFHISPAGISQKVKGILIWNLQHIAFIWRQRYWQIFKFALVYPSGQRAILSFADVSFTQFWKIKVSFAKNNPKISSILIVFLLCKHVLTNGNLFALRRWI